MYSLFSFCWSFGIFFAVWLLRWCCSKMQHSGENYNILPSFCPHFRWACSSGWTRWRGRGRALTMASGSTASATPGPSWAASSTSRTGTAASSEQWAQPRPASSLHQRSMQQTLLGPRRTPNVIQTTPELAVTQQTSNNDRTILIFAHLYINLNHVM